MDLKQPFENYMALNAPFYCRTVEMAPKINKRLPEQARVSTFFAAYKKHDNNYWTVYEARLDHGKNEMSTKVKTDFQNMSFHQAMQFLAYQERVKLKGLNDAIPDHIAVGQSIKDLGDQHFIAYMEREGFMLDRNGNVQMRPHNLALPSNASFTMEDIERANSRWQTKDISKHLNPAAGLPQLDLIDLFQGAANSPVDAESILSGDIEQRITVLEKYIHHLSKSNEYQNQYLNEYRELDRGHLISASIDHLEKAQDIVVKNFRSAGIPHRDRFQMFVYKRQIDIKLLHAIVLQNVINEDLHKESKNTVSKEEQWKANRKQINAYIKDVQKMLKDIDATSEKIDLVPQVVIQSQPAVSPFLAWIVQDFKEQMKRYREAALNNNHLPEDEIIPRLIRENKEAQMETANDDQKSLKTKSAKPSP